MKYVVTINDKSYEVEVEKGVAQVLNITNVAPQAPVTVAMATPVATDVTQAGDVIASPMPGVIVAVKKSVGNSIKKGEVIIILEAMKMENEIIAAKDGVISQIITVKGATVNTGDPLFVVS